MLFSRCPSVSCIVWLFACVVLAAPQSPENATDATVAFTVTWEQASPQFSRFEVASSGLATYLSRDGKEDEQPYTENLTLKSATRRRIFELAQQANYFNGSFDFTQHRIAQTGVKTLAYHDGAHNYQTSYNWSENKAIDELTRIFRSIGNTIEAGRRLDYLIRFDKLGLDKQLKGMEDAAAQGEMSEFDVIAPALREIAFGSNYMHIAQERARRLLKLANP